jgi:hypothetical protein
MASNPESRYMMSAFCSDESSMPASVADQPRKKNPAYAGL